MGQVPLESSITLYLKVHSLIHKTSFTYTKHCYNWTAFKFHTSCKTRLTHAPSPDYTDTCWETCVNLRIHTLQTYQAFLTQQWTDSIHWLIMLRICCKVRLLEKTPHFKIKDLTSHILSEMWCSSFNDLPFL